MGQPWKTYLVVALIVGLLLGASVGWLSKPAERVEVPGATVTVKETVAGPTVTKTVTVPIRQANASIPSEPIVKEKRWNTCRSYTIVFEIEADFGDSQSMRIAEIKAYLKNVETFYLEIVDINITLGAEIESLSTKVALTVHPKRGIVPVGFCATFDLKIDVKIDVTYMQLGEEKKQTLIIQSPPISIEVCG